LPFFFFAFLWLDKIRLLHVDVGYVGWLLGVPQFFFGDNKSFATQKWLKNTSLYTTILFN
jgi:hypothetical protein